jgi:hypothetical protein
MKGIMICLVITLSFIIIGGGITIVATLWTLVRLGFRLFT